MVAERLDFILDLETQYLGRLLRLFRTLARALSVVAMSLTSDDRTQGHDTKEETPFHRSSSAKCPVVISAVPSRRRCPSHEQRLNNR